MTLLRSSAAALLLSGSLLAVPALAADPELTVFDWAGFEEPVIFQGYVDKYGASPTFAFYGDDDEAYQKLASGFKADVAHPCSQMVSKYRDAGLIEPWDVSRIPAFSTIDPSFLHSPIFKDDTGVWYIPTDWGATAIAYNPETVPAEDVSTLQVFVDPKYQGRTSLPDSSDDVWALGYLATGTTDWTNVTDEQFQAAADWLRQAHQNVAAYWADPSEQAQLMASGAVDIEMRNPVSRGTPGAATGNGADTSGGYGLVGLRERVELSGGRMSIAANQESPEGKEGEEFGWSIQLPLAHKEAAQ